MSALDDVRRALTDAYGTGPALHDLTTDDLITAARVEMRLTTMEEAVALLRGQAARKKAVRHWSAPGLRQAALVLEKATAEAAPATPGLNERQARLLDAIRTHGGEWTTRRVIGLFALTDPGVVQRGTARRDLEALNQAGHLVLIDDPDKRHYALHTRKDGRS